MMSEAQGVGCHPLVPPAQPCSFLGTRSVCPKLPFLQRPGNVGWHSWDFLTNTSSRTSSPSFLSCFKGTPTSPASLPYFQEQQGIDDRRWTATREVPSLACTCLGGWWQGLGAWGTTSQGCPDIFTSLDVGQGAILPKPSFMHPGGSPGGGVLAGLGAG